MTEKVLPFRRKRRTIRELTAHQPKPPDWAPGASVDVAAITDAITRAVTIDAPPPDSPEPSTPGPEPSKDRKL